MKRIGTSDGRFVDGSRRVPGTPVSADWLNGMQEAIAQVLEHYDGQVDPENDRQLLDVLRHQVAARFESIAALRAFGGGRAGQAVDVAGYYAGRPGSGSGVFVALGADKTRADNGGTIIVDAAGMRWMRLGKTFDLYDFGASGNGSADDTDAVERALAHAAATGSEMMVPAGVFRLTRKIAIHQGMSIKGCGYREKDAGGAEKLTGSWLFFDHADKGIEFDGDAGYFTGAELCDFGIVRPQPAPVDGVEWTPADAQWDIYFHLFSIFRHDSFCFHRSSILDKFTRKSDNSTIHEPIGAPLNAINHQRPLCRYRHDRFGHARPTRHGKAQRHQRAAAHFTLLFRAAFQQAAPRPVGRQRARPRRRLYFSGERRRNQHRPNHCRRRRQA